VLWSGKNGKSLKMYPPAFQVLARTFGVLGSADSAWLNWCTYKQNAIFTVNRPFWTIIAPLEVHQKGVLPMCNSCGVLYIREVMLKMNYCGVMEWLSWPRPWPRIYLDFISFVLIFYDLICSFLLRDFSKSCLFLFVIYMCTAMALVCKPDDVAFT